VHAGKLTIGWARGEITPPRKTLVQGQFYTRISNGVVSPLTATALAIEGRGPNGAAEQAVFLSCDLTGNGFYLPTQRALDGGHYSAMIKSNWVGPQGGQMLVDETVSAINALFGGAEYPRALTRSAPTPVRADFTRRTPQPSRLARPDPRRASPGHAGEASP
jgi:hypothetical protein